MILQGDALSVLKTLQSESVDMCVTSPPYYGLRDYGVEGQLGLEESPEKYIDRLVEVFREVKRVLRDDGTLWLNIADCYAGSGKGAAQYPDNAAKYKQGTNKGMVGASKTTTVKTPGIKHKDLIGIPWMLAFALRADGWYLRQDIIWHKPNPMPESVTDRCTKAHEYIFLLSKREKYYFDSDATKEPAKDTKVSGSENPPRFGGKKYGENNERFYATKSGKPYQYTGLRNKRDVWSVTVRPFRGAHFATFPEALVEPCILAGSRRGGAVLDCFNGAGTTGVVCAKTGREYIGIELNPEYVRMSEERISAVQEQIEIENAQTTLWEEWPCLTSL